MLRSERNSTDNNSYNNDDNIKNIEGIFKLSDYDWDKDERKLKYKDYKVILCEKCNKKFNRDWLCRNCYNNETDEEKHRMLHGKCKGCSQVMKIPYWCSPCNSNRLQQDFDKWTSGNDYVNKLIKDNQASAHSKHFLEWIPYEKFTDLKFIAKGGFAKVFSATWTDGRIEKWDHESNIWKRSGSFEIALKILNDSRDLNGEFLNELTFLKKFPNYRYKDLVECYGITRDPKTLNYALVFELKDCSLRNYLDDYYNSLTLEDKLDIIKYICLGLNRIHSYNIIHRDLHSGNILLKKLNSFKKISDVSISDFGLCRPAGEVRSAEPKENVYGIVPYIAPEVLRGNEYTQASDIYSLGIIINEIIFGNRPFNSRAYDEYLAIEICDGLRPNIRDKTPEPLREIIQKCWDENPKNRPDTGKIYDMLRGFIYTKNEGSKEHPYNFRKHTKQYEENKNSSYDLVNELNESTIIISPSESQEENQNRSPNANTTSSSIIVVRTTKQGSISEHDETDECLECVVTTNPNYLSVNPIYEIII